MRSVKEECLNRMILLGRNALERALREYPPFNVDLVDAERIKGEPRLPFGLPGVNKKKKVGNGNYLWIRNEASNRAAP